MPRYTWTVNAYTDSGAYELANVQSININYGRRLKTDPWAACTANISGRVPSSLPADLKVGSFIYIDGSRSGTSYYSYIGIVSNYSVNYGFIPSMDTFDIQVEDVLGLAGRTVWTGSVAAKTAAYKSMISVGALSNISFEQVAGTPTYDGVPTQALTGSATSVLETLNILANTSQVIIYDYSSVGYPTMNYRTAAYSAANPIVEFTDTTPQASAIAAKYEQIELGGLAETYASQVVVQPNGLADQTVGTPPKSWTIATYDSTTSHALQTATDIYAYLDASPNQPLTISCLAEAQSTDAALNASNWQYLAGLIGGRPAVNIAFRGNKYTCVIEGGHISATPDSTRMAFTLTKVPNNKFYFTLDSPYYGILNQNQLG